MFGTDNSIEPVRGVAAAAAATAESRTAARAVAEGPLIREAMPADLASAARRARASATPDPNPVQAAAEPRGGFFPLALK